MYRQNSGSRQFLSLHLYWIASVAVAAALFLCLAAQATETKGIRPVPIKDRSGKNVGLYKGSYALLIGVSDYTAGWPDLGSVPAELDHVAAALEKQGFRVVRVMDPDSAALKRAYEGFIARYGYVPENRLLFFFSVRMRDVHKIIG